MRRTPRTRHVDDIVHTPSDPDVAVGINARPITGKVVALRTGCRAASDTPVTLPLAAALPLAAGADSARTLTVQAVHVVTDLEWLEVCLLEALVVLVQVCSSTAHCCWCAHACIKWMTCWTAEHPRRPARLTFVQAGAAAATRTSHHGRPCALQRQNACRQKLEPVENNGKQPPSAVAGLALATFGDVQQPAAHPAPAAPGSPRPSPSAAPAAPRRRAASRTPASSATRLQQ